MSRRIGIIGHARISIELSIALAELDVELATSEYIADTVTLHNTHINKPIILAKEQPYKPWGKKYRRYNK